MKIRTFLIVGVVALTLGSCSTTSKMAENSSFSKINAVESTGLEALDRESYVILKDITAETTISGIFVTQVNGWGGSVSYYDDIQGDTFKYGSLGTAVDATTDAAKISQLEITARKNLLYEAISQANEVSADVILAPRFSGVTTQEGNRQTIVLTIYTKAIKIK